MTADRELLTPDGLGEDDLVLVPRWATAVALFDHWYRCPYCATGRDDLCRDEEFTRTFFRAHQGPSA